MPGLACNELLQLTFTHRHFNHKLWIIYTSLNENLQMKDFSLSSYQHVKLCSMAKQWTEDYPVAFSLATPPWLYSFSSPTVVSCLLYVSGPYFAKDMP